MRYTSGQVDAIMAELKNNLPEETFLFTEKCNYMEDLRFNNTSSQINYLCTNLQTLYGISRSTLWSIFFFKSQIRSLNCCCYYFRRLLPSIAA